MKKKIILVIEQEINLANGLKSILEKEDYEVVSVFGSQHLAELFLGSEAGFGNNRPLYSKATRIKYIAQNQGIVPGTANYCYDSLH